MIPSPLRLTSVTMVAVIALLLASCASSPPTRFYTLTGLPVSQPPAKETGVKAGSVVAVGPVSISDYLDRPQIVTRTAENQLTFEEFDRWAGPLNEEINRVMIENLSALLSPRGIHVISWKTAIPGRVVFGLSVTRFEATPQGTVNFRALWGLGRDGEKAVRLIRESAMSKPLGRDGDYGAVAAAMSTLLTDFSREVAAAIEEDMVAGATTAR